MYKVLFVIHMKFTGLIDQLKEETDTFMEYAWFSSHCLQIHRRWDIQNIKYQKRIIEILLIASKNYLLQIDRNWFHHQYEWPIKKKYRNIIKYMYQNWSISKDSLNVLETYVMINATSKSESKLGRHLEDEFIIQVVFKLDIAILYHHHLARPSQAIAHTWIKEKITRLLLVLYLSSDWDVIMVVALVWHRGC